MITKTSFNQIKATYPFISEFPEKLQELISSQIAPDSEISSVSKVTINGKNGCLFLLENKAVAFWLTRFLFKKLPTVQEFHFSQINEIKTVDSKGLFIHASSDPNVLNEDYEEGQFVFESAKEKEEIEKVLRSKSSRLQ
jgi:hypothetical protein